MLQTFIWWRLANASGFDFRSGGHLCMAVVYLPLKFGVDICIQSRVIDISLKFNMAAAASLDFQFMWIWPFWRVDSVVFVFSTKFGLNICYSRWDRRTYAQDLHLMTSRELTSGFDFLLRGHLRMAWCIFSYNLMQTIFIQSKVRHFFRNSRWRPPPSWFCLNEPLDHPRSLIRGAYFVKKICRDRLGSFPPCNNIPQSIVNSI